MRLDAEEGAGGIINTGFWGISVEAGQRNTSCPCTSEELTTPL